MVLSGDTRQDSSVLASKRLTLEHSTNITTLSDSPDTPTETSPGDCTRTCQSAFFASAMSPKSRPTSTALARIHHIGMAHLFASTDVHDTSWRYWWKVHVLQVLSPTARRRKVHVFREPRQQPHRSKEDNSLAHIFLKESEVRSTQWKVRRSLV